MTTASLMAHLDAGWGDTVWQAVESVIKNFHRTIWGLFNECTTSGNTRVILRENVTVHATHLQEPLPRMRVC